MKNEWDFFADVQRRLASGQQLVQGYCVDPIAFPFDELRGIVLDEDGTQYELGADYKQALGACIQQVHTSWGVCFRERVICLGPQVVTAGFTADYVAAYEAAVESAAR